MVCVKAKYFIFLLLLSKFLRKTEIMEREISFTEDISIEKRGTHCGFILQLRHWESKTKEEWSILKTVAQRIEPHGGRKTQVRSSSNLDSHVTWGMSLHHFDSQLSYPLNRNADAYPATLRVIMSISMLYVHLKTYSIFLKYKISLLHLPFGFPSENCV